MKLTSWSMSANTWWSSMLISNGWNILSDRYLKLSSVVNESSKSAAMKLVSSIIWLNGNAFDRHISQNQSAWLSSRDSIYLLLKVRHFTWNTQKHKQQVICLECCNIFFLQTGQLSIVIKVHTRKLHGECDQFQVHINQEICCTQTSCWKECKETQKHNN